jgi:hypothetical protein
LLHFKDDWIMRTKRPRRYMGRHWLMLMRPFLRYSKVRDAYVLRLVGRRAGPVLRVDRRPRRPRPYGGVERRRTSAA